mmetsp:Transcript_36906/g.114871  ORF Transcript_36906/g.114871 Transcript_36906/m.114871 type:complete len:318 (-) Transcript_36906:89-1042(-)
MARGWPLRLPACSAVGAGKRPRPPWPGDASPPDQWSASKRHLRLRTGSRSASMPAQGPRLGAWARACSAEMCEQVPAASARPSSWSRLSVSRRQVRQALDAAKHNRERPRLLTEVAGDLQRQRLHLLQVQWGQLRCSSASQNGFEVTIGHQEPPRSKWPEFELVRRTGGSSPHLQEHAVLKPVAGGDVDAEPGKPLQGLRQRTRGQRHASEASPELRWVQAAGKLRALGMRPQGRGGDAPADGVRHGPPCTELPACKAPASQELAGRRLPRRPHSPGTCGCCCSCHGSRSRHGHHCTPPHRVWGCREPKGVPGVLSM